MHNMHCGPFQVILIHFNIFFFYIPFNLFDWMALCMLNIHGDIILNRSKMYDNEILLHFSSFIDFQQFRMMFYCQWWNWMIFFFILHSNQSSKFWENDCWMNKTESEKILIFSILMFVWGVCVYICVCVYMFQPAGILIRFEYVY